MALEAGWFDGFLEKSVCTRDDAGKQRAVRSQSNLRLLLFVMDGEPILPRMANSAAGASRQMNLEDRDAL